MIIINIKIIINIIMLLSSVSDFLLINAYFYKCCILEYDTSYKSVISLFDNDNHIQIFDDVYNLYLAIYLLPKLISPLTFCKLKITNDEYYNRYINYSLRKCFINKDSKKNNNKFINNVIGIINLKK